MPPSKKVGISLCEKFSVSQLLFSFTYFVSEYSFNKAIDYYKVGLQHARNARDKARLYLLIAQVHMALAPRQLERDAKGKSIQRACQFLSQCMETCSDFDTKIHSDLEDSLRSLMLGQLIEKFQDTNSLTILFELIFQYVHKRMSSLKEFMAKELYKFYFK